MIIPRPDISPVIVDMNGLNWWRQIVAAWKNPPRFVLDEDWVVTLDCGLVIIIPRGFVTDGASIPRLLWFLISPFGPLFLGAILHDFGYQHGYLLSPFNPGDVYNISSYNMRYEHENRFGEKIPVYVGSPQRFFDQLLRFVTVETSGATFQASAACYALSLFGYIAWGKYRKLGPGAYNSNSLDLPGIDAQGKVIV
jgi:hypothetical protein